MSRVEKSTTIQSDPGVAMEYIADVTNHPAFIGPLKSVTNLSGDSREPGTTWDWVFVMAGVEFSGKAETLEYLPGRRFRYRTTTGIRSTFEYWVEPEDGASRLGVNVEYEVPEGLLARVQKAVVEKLNDAEGVRTIENLGAILDG
ncbi:MAG TPA: SRPBCC family protein [Gemmatimonadota bacterium]|nr:SRPBCC family protein [Gemmatimonadota bacterium]